MNKLSEVNKMRAKQIEKTKSQEPCPNCKGSGSVLIQGVPVGAENLEACGVCRGTGIKPEGE